MERKAFIYTRISSDREGRRLGVERQEEQCRAVALALGWAVVRVYEDNDTSASTDRDPPNYNAMLRACERGEANAIIVAKVDRLHRQLWKFAPFMKWRKKHDVAFATTEGDNTETTNGRFILNIKASMAEAEAERIGERVRAAVRQRALKGEFHGGNVPFGYEGIREEGNPRYVGFQHHTTDAPRVRDAVRRLLAGETVYGISKDFGMQPRTLKRAVTNPAIAGLREYNGELFPTPWEPIVDREDWQRVCEILADPSRRKSETNQRKYMLSGLVFCHCGNRMTSTSAKRTEGPTYECSKALGGCGRARIVMRPLEEYIAEQVFTRLDSPALRAAMARDREGVDDTERELRKAVADDEEGLIRLGDERDDNLIGEAEYRRRRARLTDRLEANRAALDRATRKRAHTRLPSGTDLRAVWADRDDVWKRTILASVIERIDIGPHPINPETGRLFTSAPPRRRGEPEEAWRDRFELHRAKVFSQRVSVTWLV
ncbi:recombinase family protein [Micromonospora sp. 4G55]|uniref:recombinase family protein n=1 Tax=Micromonospora sp. 4G55 TaxID=2806102 RepID=UPI001A60088D|nr:recombinase family protein [Micromonospora sp. 4G55]MBM0259362.1 recombinase family protein [Micromonospora sp. 4G55]